MEFLHRRQFLHLAAGVAAVPVLSGIAEAQTYPTRPVRIIVGFAAGGGADIVARLMGPWLSERLGQQFVVENRVGAGTNIATEAVAHAAPDGYTLLLINPANAINTTFYDKLQFRFHSRHRAGRKHLAGRLYYGGQSGLSRPRRFLNSSPMQRPIRASSISPQVGIGTSPHMSGEMFKMMAGIDMIHIPFRRVTCTDLLGGQVQVHVRRCPRQSSTSGPASCGRWDLYRHDALRRFSRIPIVAHIVPGYDASVWYGIGAPKEYAGRNNRPAEQ